METPNIATANAATPIEASPTAGVPSRGSPSESYTGSDTDQKWETLAWQTQGASEPLHVPFAILAGEALDVARFCQRNWKAAPAVPGRSAGHAGLESAVGNGAFNESISQEILELHDALQSAQTRYQLLLSAATTAPMERAQFILSELRGALEWLFDDGKDDASDAQLLALHQTHDGASSQDTIAAALFDYAELANQHREAISGLGGFDVKLIDEAKEMGRTLREQSAGPGQTQVAPAEQDALELRNRLGSILWERMQRVRSAARFVFRGHPEIIRQVTSSYARRQRKARVAHAQPAAGPVPAPVAGAPVAAASTNGSGAHT